MWTFVSVWKARVFSVGPVRKKTIQSQDDTCLKKPIWFYSLTPGREPAVSLLLLVSHVHSHSILLGWWICDTVTVPSYFSMRQKLCKVWSLLRLMVSNLQWLSFSILPHFSCHQHLDETGSYFRHDLTFSECQMPTDSGCLIDGIHPGERELLDKKRSWDIQGWTIKIILEESLWISTHHVQKDRGTLEFGG